MKMVSVFLSVPILFLLSFLTEANAQQSQWATDAVWYQIFPERFRNGDRSNDPTKQDIQLPNDHEWQISPWTSDWYKLQPWEEGHEFYSIVTDRRYGGDLKGVLDQLDYLQALGITAIYFNPLFESNSHHKYDASNYHHIDHTFGPDPVRDRMLMETESNDPKTWRWTAADSLFLALIKEAHARKLKIVIDVTFNHCGTAFFAFQDVVRNQRRSRYADWFDIRAWDDEQTPQNEFAYRGWWHLPSMPQFREDVQGFVQPVREYFFRITQRWMDPNGDGDPTDGIDGWRLSVANLVSPIFWREWRQFVKSLNPNAHIVIVGEVWENAAEWLKGNQSKHLFDAVMNNRLARACVRFFINSDSSRCSVREFDQELRDARLDYSDAATNALQSLLESHDTDRLPSQIMNPNRRFDTDNGLQQNPNYDISAPTEAARRIQKLIVLFQMTYVGAPIVYYGSEAGMWGVDDPDDRKPMVWKDLVYENEAATPQQTPRRSVDTVRFDSKMFAWYQKLIQVRKESKALRRGGFRTVRMDNDRGLYVFERSVPGEAVWIVINNSQEEQALAIESPMRNLLTHEQIGDRIRIEAKSGAVFRR